jgi:hypothetical protein
VDALVGQRGRRLRAQPRVSRRRASADDHDRLGDFGKDLPRRVSGVLILVCGRESLWYKTPTASVAELEDIDGAKSAVG